MLNNNALDFLLEKITNPERPRLQRFNFMQLMNEKGFDGGYYGKYIGTLLLDGHIIEDELDFKAS